jgi:hypothetical protein
LDGPLVGVDKQEFDSLSVRKSFPQKGRAVMSAITEQQLRAAFYDQVICTQKTKRLVAVATLEGESNDRFGVTSGMQIFVPNSPYDEYDLVLSLCVDGSQRVTVDWDQGFMDDPMGVIADYYMLVRGCPLSRAHTRVTTATPSSHHWALWGDAQVSWDTVRTVLANVNNPGYLAMNEGKGYCALRPPWRNKYNCSFHDAMGVRFNREPDYGMFAGIDWSRVTTPPPPPVGTGWDDLFAEDED